jgi:MFS family permease
VTRPPTVRPEGLQLGLRANLAQFCLLVGVNALVGGMVGQERSLLSLLATEVFGLAAVSAALTYIVAFGLTKAATNLLAGALADRYGRKPVLVAGWLAGLPVPLLIIWAPTWGWIIAANVLLGVNQGLCWSTTVIMKIDLAGPRRRGLAMGLNEAAGYLAVAVTAYLPASAWGCRRCWSARPAGTPSSKPAWSTPTLRPLPIRARTAGHRRPPSSGFPPARC